MATAQRLRIVPPATDFVEDDADEMSTCTSPNVKIKVGDWDSYLRYMAVFREKNKHFSKDEQSWRVMLMRAHHAAIRDYLGPKLRSFTREPKILTQELIDKLKASNLAARKKRAPYFVAIASLYQQIENFELELSKKQ